MKKSQNCKNVFMYLCFGVCCTSKCEYSSSTTACDHGTECTEPAQCTGIKF